MTEGVANSACLLLVQTKSVLTRPWCLLEIFEAVRLSIPIVTVLIDGGGYDFAEAAHFLQNLEAELELANPGALKELRERLEKRGFKVETLAHALSNVLPSIISVGQVPCTRPWTRPHAVCDRAAPILFPSCPAAGELLPRRLVEPRRCRHS